MDKKLLEILACPVCKGELKLINSNELVCYVDKLVYPIKDNMPVMLEEEARNLTDAEYDSR